MVIKVSSLLAHNTDVVLDTSPTLGGPLNTGNFPILNNGNPVTITGNQYPITTGTPGQVLTTNGLGILSWSTITGVGTVTSVGLTSSATSITISGSSNPIISSGIFDIDLPLSGVAPTTYGSSSNVGTFIVNSRGIITSAVNSPISITPAQAGLGNITNALQVINNGGTPSIEQGTGNPSPPSNLGAVYIDRAVTNGNGIYYYNGTSWDVVAQKLNLYNEKSSSYTSPTALGNNSIALGEGAETTAAAPQSLAIGMQSLARLPGAVVQANGRFSSNGDAQAGRYILRTTTIDASTTEMFLNGQNGGQRLILSDNSTWTFKITVTAHRTDLDNGHAGYTGVGVIYRGSGVSSTAIQGRANKVVLAESNPVWDINIIADSINGSLKVTVNGEAGKQIRWVALVETVEITN